VSSQIFKANRTWFLNPAVLNDVALSKCYYHFMFGLWLPLLNLYRRGLFEKDQRVILLSQGQFNSQLKELNNAGISTLQTIPDIESLVAIERIDGHVSHFVLDSLEAYFFTRGRFCVRPAALDSDTLAELAKYGVSHFYRPPEKTYDVLIIDRGDGDKGHGKNTRRIVNLEELAGAVSNHFGWEVNVLTVEGMTMSEQISLFHSAKYVIAQHGSVLGHLLWMRPDRSGVVELLPEWFNREGWEYFSLLADAMGVSRMEVAQPGPFSPAPIDLVLAALQQLQNLIH
jgi:hypothetical protein